MHLLFSSIADRRVAVPDCKPGAAPILCVAILVCCLGPVAHAERADRTKPMVLESDRPCEVNLQRQTSVCSGNVVVSQGTFQLRADRLELRETPQGYQVAVATGTDAQPARFRQKRDGVDETVEGQARRIHYDGRLQTLTLEGQAVGRRLRAAVVADEMQGASIVWDGVAEQFTLLPGSTTASPGGRVRAVIVPKGAAQEIAPATGAPSAPGLRPSQAPGDRR